MAELGLNYTVCGLSDIVCSSVVLAYCNKIGNPALWTLNVAIESPREKTKKKNG